MGITFQLATEAFIPELLDMMADFNAIDGYPFDPALTRQNLLKFITNQELGRLWVIRHGDETTGYVVLAFGFSFEYGGRDAFIDELYIREAFRNQGLGRETIEFVEGQAKRLGVNTLHLEVEQHNEQGNHLYLKQGYRANNRMLLNKQLTNQ